jgi:hypothetical protein
MTQPNIHICFRRRGFKSSPAHHGQNFLETRHQFHTSILISNWILNNQRTSIWNLGSDTYFEYTSCYFKIVTLFIGNLFRVRLPYLFLIRSFHVFYKRRDGQIVKYLLFPYPVGLDRPRAFTFTVSFSLLLPFSVSLLL